MKKYWKNILLRFMKLIFIFMGITEKKYKLMKMGINLYYVKLMFFFTKYLLALEINEKGHTDKGFIFEEKRQEALEKNLGCKFIRINTSKEGYDANYEASTIQVFTSTGRQLKKSNKNLKEPKDKIEKLIDQITQQNRLPSYK